ncbi:ABC transporter permease subunit [Streptomyces sp. NPDC058657]|uniref:ABC transporter permease subunit n=1 Tax=unclassified Streptomyces TaxID=2593676 RepID=UPI0036543AC4
MTTPATPYQQQGAAPAQQQQEWQGPQQHGPGYASPVPLRRATLMDALASEWTKIRSVRSTIWTLGVMVVLVLGVGALITLALTSADSLPTEESPVMFGFVGVLLGLIPVITLGVMTIASEYGTGMIRTTLTACPSRARVLTAKAVVFFLLTFCITLVATAIVSALMAGVLGGSTGGDLWLRATLGVSFYVACTGLLSLAVGSLIRHSAGAITIMIGFVLMPLVMALFMMSESLRDVQMFLLEYSVPSQLGSLYGTEMGDGGPTGWEPLGIIAVLAALFLGLAFLVQHRRDV